MHVVLKDKQPSSKLAPTTMYAYILFSIQSWFVYIGWTQSRAQISCTHVLYTVRAYARIYASFTA